VLAFGDAEGRYRLVTMRSNDQFNKTIYGYSDRFRGIEGTRDVVLMCADDIRSAGLHGITRELPDLKVTQHNLPRGTIGAYYPEANVLVAIDHHDELSKTPASKAVPVRIQVKTHAAL